jgi:hypothetical protein
MEFGGFIRCQATQDPYVADEIESQVALLRSTPAESQATEAVTTPPRRTSVDPQPVRRQVTAILHSLD